MKAFNGVVSVYKHLGGTLNHGTAFETEIHPIVAAAVAANINEDVAVATKRATAVMSKLHSSSDREPSMPPQERPG